MSFTTEVKTEITQQPIKDCCQKAQLSALIQLNASLIIHEQQLQLLIHSENASTAKRIFKLLKDSHAPKMALSVTKKTKLGKNNVYELEITSKVKEILSDLGLMTDKGIQSHPSKKIVSKECCARSYLAGAFLAAGSVNSPTKSNYHLEIVTQQDEHASFVESLMKRFELPAKTILRRNQFVTYLKASDKISDFLRIVSANSAVLDFEEIRIQRDFHNSLTRLDNCEVANEMKTQAAASKQITAIERLIKRGVIANLDERYSIVARLRMENPEANLNELCELYEEETGTAISKSGIKHRLTKLMGMV
jgi:cell division protein WhiA